jgi:hypothetical protein
MYIWIYRIVILGMVIVLNHYGNASPCDSWYSFDSCEVIDAIPYDTGCNPAVQSCPDF